MRLWPIIALAGALTAGDSIELELALWRHQPDRPFDMLEAHNLLREGGPKPAFDMRMIRRNWEDQAPSVVHSPTAERMAPSGLRSNQ